MLELSTTVPEVAEEVFVLSTVRLLVATERPAVPSDALLLSTTADEVTVESAVESPLTREVCVDPCRVAVDKSFSTPSGSATSVTMNPAAV